MSSGSKETGSGTQRGGSEVASLELYGYPECPYCQRVLSAVDTLGLDVPLRDTMRDDAANDAVYEATGRETVPVLRITREDGSVEWMRESLDIVRYLKERYGSAPKA